MSSIANSYLDSSIKSYTNRLSSINGSKEERFSLESLNRIDSFTWLPETQRFGHLLDDSKLDNIANQKRKSNSFSLMIMQYFFFIFHFNSLDRELHNKSVNEK